MLTRRVVLPFLALVLVAGACGVGGRSLPTILPTLSGEPTRIYAADGTLITEVRSDEHRLPVTLEQVPFVMQSAIVAIEDERFWEHNGVDPRAIARAAKTNTDEGGVAEGGSTITQQYVKNVFLTPDRTIQRKLEEASLAYQLEQTYTKAFILEQYLNTVYFGNRSYGVEAASQGYFGVSITQVDLPQAALLAGLVQSPTRTDPFRNPDGALSRRNVVLARMHEQGRITDDEYVAAIDEPITLLPAAASVGQARYPAAHFVEEVKRFILRDESFGETEADRQNLLFNGGLKIFTTIDLEMQAKAEAAALERYPNQGRSDPDVGLVSIETGTGYVRAMVGGYDYFGEHDYAQVNLAMGNGRQSGSTMKPVVLAAALENGVGLNERFPAPRSTVINVPGHEPWPVSGHALGNNASLTECVVDSANTCFANIMADERVRPEYAAEYAGRLGIDVAYNPDAPAGRKGFARVLSLVLGTNNTTVLDMAESYTSFANNGLHVPAEMVTKVVDSEGAVRYQHQHAQTRVMSSTNAAAITDMMEQVLTRGTAAGKGILRPAAGKTGTTQNSRDALFVGYTPDLVTSVWVGYASKREGESQVRTVGQAGGTAAAPIWQSFMLAAHDGMPPRDFDFRSDGSPITTTTTSVLIDPDLLEVETRPGRTSMPDVSDMDVDEASAAIRRAGLRMRRVDVSPVDGILPGQVQGQAPPAGDEVIRGMTVTVESTPGDPPPKDPIPEIGGLLLTDARTVLEDIGFTVTVEERAAPAPRAAELLAAAAAAEEAAAAAEAAATGSTTTTSPDPPPTTLPSGTAWGTTPGTGDRSRDGNVTLMVQP